MSTSTFGVFALLLTIKMDMSSFYTTQCTECTRDTYIIDPELDIGNSKNIFYAERGEMSTSSPIMML